MCRGVRVSAEERETAGGGGGGGGGRERGLPASGEKEDFPAHPRNGTT